MNNYGGTRFLRELYADIHSVNPELIPIPEEELQTHEKSVGNLPRELRSLYAVFVASKDELDAATDVLYSRVTELVATSAEGIDPRSLLELAGDYMLMVRRHGIVESVFCLAIETKFSALAFRRDKEIVVCKGWQIVVRRKKEELWDAKAIVGLMKSISELGELRDWRTAKPEGDHTRHEPILEL